MQVFRFGRSLAFLALAGLTVVAGCSGTSDPAESNQITPVTSPTAQLASQETPTSPAPTTTTQPSPTPTLPAPSPTPAPSSTTAPTPTTQPTPTQAPVPTLEPLPDSAHLTPMTHAFQTWNNCSAVSASMTLSYFGITKSQQELATVFRPNLEDKHVEPRQLVRFFPDYNLRIKLVEGGSVERIKQFLAQGIPVITPQWLDFDPDAIGHYRVVRGYDDARGGFLVNDSMTGANVFYSYQDFEKLWRAFNYRYLPVYRPEQESTVLAILGDDADRTKNLQRTLELFQGLARQNPNDAYIQFSIGTGHYELGNIMEAIKAYERAADIGLPPKMLWYQFWPVAAYNEVGNHRRALDLAAEQLAVAATFGEMRYERGRAYEAMGQTQMAIQEYRQALRDDANLQEARDALARLGG